MRDSELCALIDRQCDNGIGADSLFAQQRERAMEFYLGEARGELSPPTVDGRSRVVSKDLMDTVEWAMPGIMEALTGADDVVTFKPRRPGDEQSAEDATSYVNHVIYEENEGFITLHDAIKQALIARMGVVKVWCDKSWEEEEERYQGLSIAEVQALENDPDIEVVEVVPYGEQPTAGMTEGMPPELAIEFEVVAKRKAEKVKFRVEGVPPEEFRVNKDARTLESAEFVAHEVERTASYLISEGWPKDEVNKLPRGRAYRYEGDELARHDYDGSWDYNADEGDKSQQKIIVTEAYIRVDTNDDGIAELRRVVKAGTYIHENEVTDDHPFALGTPILMPYKVIGLGLYDLVEDLQRIKTALSRQVLDNVYLTNNPRTEVIENQVNLDDLLNPRPGGIVRVKAQGAMREVTVPFVAEAGLAVMQAIDQVRDTRTGVTEANSAMTADSLSKSNVGSEGVQALMNSGAQRIRLIARVLAETLVKRIYRLVLKEVTQYQDRPAQIQINGRWLEVNPREWKNGFHLRVNVGVGTTEKRQQIANLTMLGEAQGRLMEVGIVTPENLLNTATDLVKAMGYHEPERYFSQPQPPQPEGPPPEVMLEQMKQQGRIQEIQIKAQTDIQVEQMKQEAQAQQALAETQLEAQRNELDRQAQANQAALKLRYDAELAQLKLQYEDADREREHEFLRWKAELDAAVKIETANISSKAKLENSATETATAEITREVQP
ncbi:portal protein [Stenotrophomonas maltophilia]|uniref:portal protein n=1 Tax=Stenotrophomonas maltophilia TaxID=40324 RepID=UPI003CEED1AF